MTRVLFVGLCTMVLATGAQGDPFYMRYDADKYFPDEEGWNRYFSDPGGQIKREIDHGIFRLDTRASYDIFDFYRIRSYALDLRPGEELQLTWRMQTIETQSEGWKSDIAVMVTNADWAHAQFFIAPDFVSANVLGGDPEHLYLLDPKSAHTFGFATNDMRGYELFVDGAFAFRGKFLGYSWNGPFRVSFGDVITGRTSLSEWDFVEIRVTPDPSSAGLLVLGATAMRGKRAIATMAPLTSVAPTGMLPTTRRST